MRPTLVLLLVAAFLIPLPPVDAGSHGKCGEPGSPGIIALGPAYVDVRGPTQGVWVYLESNGQMNLQRGATQGVIPGDKDSCLDDSTHGPDTLIY